MERRPIRHRTTTTQSRCKKPMRGGISDVQKMHLYDKKQSTNAQKNQSRKWWKKGAAQDG